MKKKWPALLVTAVLSMSLIAAPARAAGSFTAASASESTLTVGALDEVQNPLQTNVYRINAKAGFLKLKAHATPDALFHVLIEPLDQTGLSDPILFNGVLHAKWPEAIIELPADGSYQVALTRMLADGTSGHGQPLELTGPGLAASSLYVPPVLLREMKPGQVMAEPFTAEAAILPGATARFLALMLDDALLSPNLLQPDGTAAPYTIDPAELPEGLHALSAVSQGPESEHTAVAVRLFTVDQVDSFTDVARSHWGRTAIEIMADEGILSGRGNGTLDPEAFVTREEFAKMLALVLGLPAPEAQESQFADIPADWWSRPHVEALATAGLIRGESINGVDYFAPERNISRAEAATILGRSLGISELPAAEAPGFSDFGQVPDWAQTSVTFLSQMKWIDGFPDGTFGPTQPLTRAQAAKILAKIVGI